MAPAPAKKGSAGFPRVICGAGNEVRTRDLNLGKVALYQLSYSRINQVRNDSDCKILSQTACLPYPPQPLRAAASARIATRRYTTIETMVNPAASQASLLPMPGRSMPSKGAW